MAIEIREDANRARAVVLTACPICDKEFGVTPGNHRAAHFLNDHTPEDFGL